MLVDFWATWCPPCRQQFPHTVELAKRFSPVDVAVVAVSMNEPSDKESVLQFLRSNEARFDNLLITYGVGAEAFEITDGIPHYKVYDRRGDLRLTTKDKGRLEDLRLTTRDKGRLEDEIQKLLDEN